MPSSVKYVTDELLQALEMAHKLLVTAPAKRISAISEEEPCVVFTDGAYEAGVASCGVVLISPRSAKAKVMSFVVPEGLGSSLEEGRDRTSHCPGRVAPHSYGEETDEMGTGRSQSSILCG